MDRRNKVILEVCEALAYGTHMELTYGVTTPEKLYFIAISMMYSISIGGIAGSFFKHIFLGAMIGGLIGLSGATTATGRMKTNTIYANAVIHDDMSEIQKSRLVQHVTHFIDGRFLVDATTCLSALARNPPTKYLIIRAMVEFFQQEMNYVVRCYIPGYTPNYVRS